MLTAEQVQRAIYDCSEYPGFDGTEYYAGGIHMQELTDKLNGISGGTDNTETKRRAITAEQVRDIIESHSMWTIGNNRCFYNGAYDDIADELNKRM